ncbi:39S ribosomal protein L53, mitochondrial [Ischnura elegans]|uniref:39S ribosomal protein L53, mitochondrial n=1 Tax=Ischnura elegans TaxID=197161 RepID=UPI001ED8A7FB|nr:39S ribosomal protein L53, mitochondrial [Ischnura elegans]
MSVPFSGTLSRSAGLVSAITKQLKNVNLKPVKQISVAFDPFHHNAASIRDFLFYIASPKVLQTNPNCRLKTAIQCTREEPIVSFALGNGETVKFKSENLTTLEILQLYNKHITPLAPVEEKSTVQTKSEKAGSRKRR